MSDTLASFPFMSRRLASMEDRAAWMKARLFNVTASDVASLSRESSIPSILSKKFESEFYGNKYTAHGEAREPFIVDWVSREHGIAGNSSVFHSESSERHLATPDGIGSSSGELVLAEIKTTNKPFARVPVKYLRQIYWQQYVLGASRTLFVWEEHKDFVPVRSEPEFVWVERDDEKIGELVRLSNLLLERIDDFRSAQRDEQQGLW